MSKIIFTIILGIIIGIIDVFPMIIKKLSRQSIVSAFLHYFFVTIIIICIDLPVLPWFIEGVVVSFALALPIAVLVYENDKKICSNYFIYIHNSWNNNQCCWKLF